MKYLRKFEELKYSTYSSAVDKLSQYGQKSRAERIKSHAEEMELLHINDMKFDILVGESRTFPGAKYQSVQVMRETASKAILMVFSSGDNTHRVLANINADGTIVWRDFNKFANRRSVNEYQRAIRLLASFNPAVKKLVDEMGLSPESLNVVSRTFYI